MNHVQGLMRRNASPFSLNCKRNSRLGVLIANSLKKVLTRITFRPKVGGVDANVKVLMKEF